MLEIGPGPGGLTRALLARGCRVRAIEKDRDLHAALGAELGSEIVVAGDALALDWALVAGGPCIVAGNIPYNITSPLIEKAMTPPWRRVVFLVQREVADRVAAAPGTAAYGALSVGVQARARAERLFVVRAGAFTPPPRVESAVLRLEPLEAPLVGDGEIGSFRRLVVGLFGFRRKQLVRGLRELTGLAPAQVAEALGAAGIDGAQRPEVLAPGQFAALLRAVVDAGWRPAVH